MNITVLILSIIITIIVVYSILNFYELYAKYNCITTDFLWKLTNNKISSCFRSRPKKCEDIDKYGTYGFCNDLDYYGIALGQQEGPYGFYCDDWVFDKKECLPQTCELANTSNKFGWCLENNRAYLGNSCGPNEKYGIRCKTWIWNDKTKCPKYCPKIKTPKISKIKKEKPKKIPKCPTKKDICLC